MTVNSFGNGAAIYVGSFADEDFYLTLVDWLMRKKKVQSVLPPADGFEATERSSGVNRIVFGLNHNENAIRVPCNGMEFQDLISGERIKDLLKIGGGDAKILKRL